MGMNAISEIMTDESPLDRFKNEVLSQKEFVYQGNKMVVNVEATKIEKFFVDGLPFTQLSDHFGIST
jgi:hypothetical protein